MTVENFSEEIFKRYGNVKRGRGCYLYTAKNVRLTDLYLEDGRALLGWDSGEQGTVFKNTFNRGANGTFITGFEHRLDKAVSELFADDRRAFIFYDYDSAEKFVRDSDGQIFEFIPWGENNLAFEQKEFILFKPVFPFASDIWIVAVSEAACSKIKNGGVKLAAPFYAAITRSVYDLIKALQERSEKDWFLFDKILCKYWERKGPYLYSKINNDDDYDKFVVFCLNMGIVINPCREGKSIVPCGVSLGTFDVLKKNEFIC